MNIDSVAVPESESPQVLRRIIERTADGIVVVDGEGMIRFVNPAAEVLFDRPAADLVGAPFGFPVTAGEITEIDILRRGGTTVVAELRVVETNWEGEDACLVSLRDVTDRKRAEEQARELAREQAARAEAQAAEQRYRRLAEEKAALAEENARLFERAQEGNKAKSEFLAVMSHELRTPLNAITGYTDLLEAEVAGPLNTKQLEQLGRIKASSRHLLELVNDILTLSRIQAGRSELHPEPIDYAALVREVVALIEPLAKEKELCLHCEVPDRPLEGETDPAKLRQILLNLLSNAVKFTERGEVRIEARQRENEVLFRIHDSGVGIPEEHMERIFEPFWQVEQSQTRTSEGTGLGLNVARRLARLLGGDITVESTPGEGSAFTVRVPLRPNLTPGA